MKFYKACFFGLVMIFGLGVSKIQAEDRPIQNWLICGPFLNADLETECFSDEAQLAPKEGDYSGGKLWKKYNFVKEGFDLEEKTVFGYQDHAVGYAYVEILSKEEGWLQLQLGSDDGIKVWWNGKITLVNPASRGLIIGQDKVNLRLQKGTNRLLIKVNDLGGGWSFAAKLAGLEGTSIENLEFSPEGAFLERLPVQKVRASTVQAGDAAQFDPKFAVDNDMTTRWSSEHFVPQWYEVYFKDLVDLARVDLYWENAFASEYKLSATQDGEHWEDIATQFQGEGGHEIIIINPPKKVTALRFFAQKKGSDWGNSFWELEAYGWPSKDVPEGTPSGTPSFEDSLMLLESEIAKPYPVASVTATSEQAPNPSKKEDFKAANAVDNNYKTRWSSAFGDPQEVKLDLGEVRKFHQILLFWETACAKEYSVDISNDDKDWETVYSTKEGKDGLKLIFFDTAKEARYVRVIGTVRKTTWGYSLWEFQVFE
jgi:hypothetical protein